MCDPSLCGEREDRTRLRRTNLGIQTMRVHGCHLSGTNLCSCPLRFVPGRSCPPQYDGFVWVLSVPALPGVGEMPGEGGWGVRCGGVQDGRGGGALSTQLDSPQRAHADQADLRASTDSTSTAATVDTTVERSPGQQKLRDRQRSLGRLGRGAATRIWRGGDWIEHHG